MHVTPSCCQQCRLLNSVSFPMSAVELCALLSRAVPLARLLELVMESLGLQDATFQHSLPAIIAWLHGQRKRSSSSQAQLKSWYSRLLFLLSRCSRLLTNDDNEEYLSSSSSNCPSSGRIAAAGQAAVSQERRVSYSSSSSQCYGSNRGPASLSPKLQELLRVGAHDTASAAGNACSPSSPGGLGSSTRPQLQACSRPGAATAAAAAEGPGNGSSAASRSHPARSRRKSAFGEHEERVSSALNV